MHRFSVLATIFLLGTLTGLPPYGAANAVPQTRTDNKNVAPGAKPVVNTSTAKTTASLKEIASQTLAFHFGHSDKKFDSLKEFADSFAVPPKYARQAGIFVTLSRNGHTRACWGSVYPQYTNLVEGTVFATVAALEKEYRFKKVRASEWNRLKPQVTVIKSVQPISNMSSQNPMLFGLLVQSGNKRAVLLPGECSDSYSQLVQCKLKAGINAKQRCQMYRIVADVFN